MKNRILIVTFYLILISNYSLAETIDVYDKYYYENYEEDVYYVSDLTDDSVFVEEDVSKKKLGIKFKYNDPNIATYNLKFNYKNKDLNVGILEETKDYKNIDIKKAYFLYSNNDFNINLGNFLANFGQSLVFSSNRAKFIGFRPDNSFSNIRKTLKGFGINKKLYKFDIFIFASIKNEIKYKKHVINNENINAFKIRIPLLEKQKLLYQIDLTGLNGEENIVSLGKRKINNLSIKNEIKYNNIRFLYEMDTVNKKTYIASLCVKNNKSTSFKGSIRNYDAYFYNPYFNSHSLYKKYFPTSSEFGFRCELEHMINLPDGTIIKLKVLGDIYKYSDYKDLKIDLTDSLYNFRAKYLNEGYEVFFNINVLNKDLLKISKNYKSKRRLSLGLKQKFDNIDLFIKYKYTDNIVKQYSKDSINVGINYKIKKNLKLQISNKFDDPNINVRNNERSLYNFRLFYTINKNTKLNLVYMKFRSFKEETIVDDYYEEFYVVDSSRNKLNLGLELKW